MNYLEQAKRRWTNCPIIGGGQFAVADISEVSGRTLRVFLVETREQQTAAALGCNRCEKIDLAVDGDKLLRDMRDIYDPEERRRERRANRG
jgi:hypothetical protein